VRKVGVGALRAESDHSGPVPPELAEAAARGRRKGQGTADRRPNSDRSILSSSFFTFTYRRNLSKIFVLYIFIYCIYKLGK
jgi:hypothetical protein